MEKAKLSLIMVMFMKVIEKTMCKKETVYIRGKMEINILDNGKIMYSKEMES